MANKLNLKPEDYVKIDTMVQPVGAEVYSVVTHRHRGQIKRSIHVFSRTPNEHELHSYETQSSSVEFKGKKAKVKTAQVPATRLVYDTLIVRAYDVPVGAQVVAKLETEAAKRDVDVMTKRSAIIDLVGQVWATSSLADDEEDDDKEGD